MAHDISHIRFNQLLQINELYSSADIKYISQKKGFLTLKIQSFKGKGPPAAIHVPVRYPLYVLPLIIVPYYISEAGVTIFIKPACY